ncbi:hypothetical protein ACJ2A9_19645 [Anaerobacillus sp. MEB173]|uniref:hypothetical protein n=1 Tax=Anaerobacillus sp. MEB173 TaxID=3383345 RepID=UPI003F932144
MGKIIRFEAEEKTWMEVLEEFLYLKQAQGLSKATITGYKNHVQHFFQRSLIVGSLRN